MILLSGSNAYKNIYSRQEFVTTIFEQKIKSVTLNNTNHTWIHPTIETYLGCLDRTIRIVYGYIKLNNPDLYHILAIDSAFINLQAYPPVILRYL